MYKCVGVRFADCISFQSYENEIIETKSFHFHGVFKKNEIKLAKRPHIFIHMNPLSRNPGSTPEPSNLN